MARSALVTGATGFLGRQVAKAFEQAGWKVVGTGFSRAGDKITKLDLEDAEAVSRILDETKPQVVVHCKSRKGTFPSTAILTLQGAANRFPDKCDADPEGARRINVEATAALAKAAGSRGILLIYISTDYVFSGKEGEAPYESNAATAPPNIYGQTKLEGERAALEQKGVVLRVPVLYGPAEENKESSVNALLDVVWKAQKEKVSVDDWALRYPTNTEDVARVCKDIAERFDERPSEILQFSSEDRMTKYQICLLLAEIMGLPVDGLVPAGNDPNASVQRPYDTHLSTKALQDLGIPIWTQDFKGWWRRECNAVRH